MVLFAANDIGGGKGRAARIRRRDWMAWPNAAVLVVPDGAGGETGLAADLVDRIHGIAGAVREDDRLGCRFLDQWEEPHSVINLLFAIWPFAVRPVQSDLPQVPIICQQQ